MGEWSWSIEYGRVVWYVPFGIRSFLSAPSSSSYFLSPFVVVIVEVAWRGSWGWWWYITVYIKYEV